MSVKITGVTKVTNMVKQVRVAISKNTALKQAGVLIDNEVVRYFNQGGNSTRGGAWTPNSPATIAIKGSSRPLVDTGVLRASFRANVTGNTLKFGTPVEYARFNEEGDGVPQRPMLPSDAKIIEIITKQYNNLIDNINKRG